MLVIGIAVLVCIIGLFMYMRNPAPPSDGKVAEVGRIMFAFGLLALLLQSPEIITLIKGH